MGKARDEAGNIWETDAQGNPVRLVQPAQSNPTSNPFMDPRLPFQVQAAQGQAAASQYAAPKAQADATVAQAQAPYAGTVAQAEAAKAQADAQRAQAELQILQQQRLPPEKRADLQASLNSLNVLESGIHELEDIYGRSFKGKGLQSVAELAPAYVRPDNAKLNDAGNRLAAFISRALELTGKQFDTPAEQRLFIGSFLPKNTDTDEQIEAKIGKLNELLSNARGGMSERLGISAPQMRANSGDTRDTVDPETSRQIDQMIRAGRSNDDIIAFAKKKGFTQPPAPEALDAARSFLKQNPGYTGGFTQAIDRQRVSANQALDGLGIDPNSSLGAYGVASANALSGGTLDEIAGGGAQQAKDLLRQQNPGASLAGDITGSALAMGGLNAGLRFSGGRLAGLATRGGGIGGDMLYGAGFGAGENNDDRLMGGLGGGLAAGAGNIVGRGLVSGAGRAARGVSSPTVNYLAGRGIRMTPGQILGEGGVLGRGARAVEDAIESIPVLGSAIKMRKTEGLRDFNREAFKDALAPIGEQVQGTLGQDAIGEAQDLVSNAYGNALRGVSLRADLPFVQQAGSAVRAGRRVPEFGSDVDYLARENLGPTFGPNRTLTGEGFQSSLQDIADTAADFRKSGNVRGRNAANSMGDLRQAYLSLADRQAPGTTRGLASANVANRFVSTLGDAVTGAVNSNVESGVFTPAQLGRAAVNNTRKFGGRRAAARGDVPFAELQEAGQAVLPNVIPNSGTFDRAFAGLVLPSALGGSAYGADQLNAPSPVVATLAGLGLLSTKKGNAAFQKLLTSRNPIARSVGEEILRQRRLGGMFGGAAALPYAVSP